MFLNFSLVSGFKLAKNCSMLPKVQAIIEYLEAGGKEAIITTPENISAALRGEAGTRIIPD